MQAITIADFLELGHLRRTENEIVVKHRSGIRFAGGRLIDQRQGILQFVFVHHPDPADFLKLFHRQQFNTANILWAVLADEVGEHLLAPFQADIGRGLKPMWRECPLDGNSQQCFPSDF